MKSLCLAVIVGVLGFVVAPLAHAQVVGGFKEASFKDKPVVDAAAFAIKAQQDVMKAAGSTQKLALVKIAGAQQQVVQGMNYKLTLNVKVDDAEKTATALVWSRPWLKDEPYKLTSWKFAGEKDPEPADKVDPKESPANPAPEGN